MIWRNFRQLLIRVSSESFGLLVVVDEFLLDALPGGEVEPGGGVAVGDELPVEGRGAAAEDGVLLALVGAAVVEPGAPARGRGAGLGGEAGGHLELELAGEPVGPRGGEAGLGVLLLGLHVHVHVAHGGRVGERAHPRVAVVPRLAVDRDGLRLLRRARRVGRRRQGWRGGGLGAAVDVAAEEEAREEV